MKNLQEDIEVITREALAEIDDIFGQIREERDRQLAEMQKFARDWMAKHPKALVDDDEKV